MTGRISRPSPPLLAALALSLLLHAALLALRAREGAAADAAAQPALRVSVRAAVPAATAAAATASAPVPAVVSPAPPAVTPAPHVAAARPAPPRAPAASHGSTMAEAPAPPAMAEPLPRAAPGSHHAGAGGSAAVPADEAAGSAAPATLGPLLVAAIQRQLRYPDDARLHGLAGTAQLRFTLLPDGGIEGIAIAASSGTAALDAAAVSALRAVAPFAPARGLLGAPHHYEVPIGFRLDAARAW